MKKLLLSTAVVMAVMSANAQVATLNVAKVADKVQNEYSLEVSSSAVYNANAMKAPKKLESGANYFIEIGTDVTKGVEETKEEIYKTAGVTFEMTGEKGEYKGAQYPKVKIKGIGSGYCNVEGYVDDANGKIYIPRQVGYVHPDESKGFGEMYLEAIVFEGGELSWNKSDLILYKTKEGYVAWAGKDADEKKNGAVCGWVITMPNYKEKEGKGIFTYGIQSGYVMANGVEEGYFNTGARWEKGSHPIVVEDEGDEINVYNFLGMSKAEMLVGEKEEVQIPTNQPMAVLYSDDPKTFGEFFRLYAYKLVGENGIAPDTDAEYVKATRKDNVISTSNDTYMGVLSKLNAEGAGYRSILAVAVKWTINDDPTGIKDVNSATKKGDNKFYNLAGQRVNANTPGIVVRNGRKYINK